MCYLKNLGDQETLDPNIWNLKEEDSFETTGCEANVLFPCQEKAFGGAWSQDQQKLVSIF